MWLARGLAAFNAEIFTTRRPTTELLRCVLRPFGKTCPVYPVCQAGGWVQRTPAPILCADVLHTMASHRSWLFTSGSSLRLSSPPEHAPYPTSAWQYILILQIWSQISNPSGGLWGYPTQKKLLPPLSFKDFDLNTGRFKEEVWGDWWFEVTRFPLQSFQR